MLHIPVLYEDKDVLAVNKPAGLVVHAAENPKHETQNPKLAEPTLVDWLLKKYPHIRGIGDQSNVKGPQVAEQSSLRGRQRSYVPSAERSGMVHRLDAETSGVLVIAKNQRAFEFLKKQFQEREMKKVYRAFVYGEVKGDGGVIDRSIARSTSDFRKWTAQRGRRGREREAVTEYRVLARFRGLPLDSKGNPRKQPEPFSFLDVRPKTGRTHQIRVHLKAINHPIVCDKLYAPKRDCALGFSRLALHAFSLTFKLPSGKVFTVEAPYPEDFKSALRFLKIVSLWEIPRGGRN